MGIIYKLSKQVSNEKLKCFIEGIFYSKLSYCLCVYGNVLGLEVYKDNSTKYISYTKKDNHKLQVLQNKINRILTKSSHRTSTKDLLNMTNSLSIQQMIALQTILMTFKILKTSKPQYLANKIRYAENHHMLRSSSNSLQKSNLKLSQSREGFINRSITLYNILHEGKRKCCGINQFKGETRKLVKEHFQVK